MSLIPRIAPTERLRFSILAFLLFMNYIVIQSNGVVATSGFATNVGTSELLIVWAIDNAIILFASGLYSLVVDRVKRSQMAMGLFMAAAVVYIVLYLLFRAGAPDAVTYPILLVLNDQQWILFPLTIWALANDVFSISEAKRLFPLLGLAAFLGGIAGNGLAALVAQAIGTSELMLFNALVMIISMGALWLALRYIKIETRLDTSHEGPIQELRESLAFVRDIPAFRNLAIIMLLIGIGLNTIEYQLIVSSAAAFPESSDMQAFYGTFRMVRMIALLVVQGLIASWLLKRVGFKSVFTFVPILMFLGLFVPILLPGLVAVAAGEFFVRLFMEGIDDPARRAFLGMVPDEQRGRVTAFFDGYLYSLGAVISCGIIGIVILAANVGLIPQQLSQPLYLGISALCSAVGLYFVNQFYRTYDKSMLNWRLKRRKRGSPLANLDL